MTHPIRVDRYASMTELVRELPAEGNYVIQVDRSHRSRVKLFAPHAGCIEPCTGPVVHALAAGKFDSFLFHGLRKRDCFATLHVTSVRYDDPICRALVEEAVVALAVHGCSGKESFLEIGGGNAPLKAELAAYLQAQGYVIRLPEGRRAGESVENFINLSREQGVQIEMSEGFRRELFPHFPKPLSADQFAFPHFIGAVRAWLNHVEERPSPGPLRRNA